MKSLAHLIASLLLLSCESSAQQKHPPRSPAPVHSSDASVPVSLQTNVPKYPADWIDVKTLIPELLLDIRYASNQNFTNTSLYPVSTCLLRYAVAKDLASVQEELKRMKLQLLIWDCYRPFSIQELLWEKVSDPRYVAKPVRKNGKPAKGSKHNRGAAIDLSLADHLGHPLPMPTDHDDFSSRAQRGWTQGISAEAISNAQRLNKVMQRHGFVGIRSEWWHYDHRSWRKHPLSEHPLQ